MRIVMKEMGPTIALVVALPAMIVSAATIVAYWPVWRWYFARMTDGSDEPWGLIALVTAIASLARGKKGKTSVDWAWTEAQLLVAGGCVGVYAVLHPFLPPLARAVLAVGTLGSLLTPFARTGRGSSLGLWGLLLLSLPIVPSLQFYLGYPLRWLAAESSVVFLNMLGLAVARDGVALRWAGETILVDAPCSGIKMLWAGCYLATTLACWREMRTLPALGLMLGGVAITVTANVLRSMLLFFKEAHLLPLPEWTHAATGLVAFALAALAIQGLATSSTSRRLFPRKLRYS